MFSIFIHFFISTVFAATNCTGVGKGGKPVPYSWTDPSVVSGVTIIKAVHINDLRNATNNKRVACGFPQTTWSENITSKVTPIKKQHLDELRTSVNELIQLRAASLGTTPIFPTYTDPSIVKRVTPIKADHITELRSAIDAVSCTNPPESRRGFLADWFITGMYFTDPIWNDYKAWLIAQFATAGWDISGYDFTAMGDHFNKVHADCKNIGDGGSAADFDVMGVTIHFSVTWGGYETLKPYDKCQMTIEPTIIGDLNGYTCGK